MPSRSNRATSRSPSSAGRPSPAGPRSGSMARPTKRTPEVETAILNALRVGNTRTDSALAAGVSLGTLSEWCKRYPEFLAGVEKAEADARLRFVGIIATASRTSWQAAAWFLERRMPEHWGRREKLEVAVDA